MESKISYTLQRKQVKNINLRIRPDGNIYVSASPLVPISTIEQYIDSKGDYIARTLARFNEKRKWEVSSKKYISGESFYLLGKQLRLIVKEAPKNHIFSDGIYLHLDCRQPENFTKKQKLINDYFKKQCLETFSHLIAKNYPLFEKYDIPCPSLHIRNMTSRWGSCLPTKKQIILNTSLIHFPERCIEYIIIHEFCHFLYPNHSKKFYSFLTVLMPDWKEHKNELENIILI
ncbi:MAG: M48 family metallopeptidase [Spirochaetia bacterium]|nr:M48 family metallopeptidase [Spirochaetia bacterium]